MVNPRGSCRPKSPDYEIKADYRGKFYCDVSKLGKNTYLRLLADIRHDCFKSFLCNEEDPAIFIPLLRTPESSKEFGYFD